MKKGRLTLIIFGIIVACFDILSLLLTKDFDINFWFGFVFVQIAYALYLIIEIFIDENKEGFRGIKPLTMVSISHIVVMMIMAFVLFALPTVKNIRLIIIPYVIFICLFAIMFVVGLYNKKLIEKQE